jgi:2,4-dienoyl-CoA reductase-like NADH-dependent reductase (Old Yellow Enzyme family)
MADLFSPYQLGTLQLKNRIVMSPMCQSAVTTGDGMPHDWHYVHYVSRAVGGAGLILVEMTNVELDGLISLKGIGLWTRQQTEQYKRIAEGCHRYNAKIGIQLAHAGRKSRNAEPSIAPSAIPFSADMAMPKEASRDDIQRLIEKFAYAAREAIRAEVDTIELHGAHGYLIHQFHSRLSNKRTDEYGGDLSRFGVEVIRAVKAEMPPGMPLFMRMSAIEFSEGGYGLDHCAALCEAYRAAGVDLFDISAGGDGGVKPIREGVGYHLDYTRELRKKLGMPLMTVGGLSDPALAQSVIAAGDADLVAIGRGMLVDPYWAHHAALQLGVPVQAPGVYNQYFKPGIR